MLFDLAENMMIAAQRWHIEGHSKLVGQRPRSQRYSQKSRFRVGLWPFISDSEPEIAIGIGLVLSALLERTPSIRVYRIIARVENEPDSYEWGLQDSQFSVDDWEVEGLDENVAIWGSLDISDNVRFSIEVEDDARNDDVTFKLEHQLSSITELVNTLPSIADKIVNWLDAEIVPQPGDSYDAESADDASIVREFLSQNFYWELDYFLELWGQETDKEGTLTDLESLITLSQEMKGNFGAWLLARTLARMMMFDEMNWGQLLIQEAKNVAEKLSSHSLVAELLGIALFRLNYTLEAFDLLESTLTLHPQNSSTWNNLAALYSEAREDLAAIDVYQRAIEADAATSEIYLEYGNLISFLGERQIELGSRNQHLSPAGRPFTDRYIFTSANQNNPNMREAAAAYQHAFENDNSSVDTLTQLVTCLIFLQDDSAWKYCQELIERDKEGDVIAAIIDQLADSDVETIIKILQKSVKANPHQVSSRINLTRAYLAFNKRAMAKNELLELSNISIPPQFDIALSHLRLRTDINDFDNRIGEIKDILQASGKISSHDVEFLEEIIEKEPSYAEGYRLLAEAYLSWDEPDDALEVLLDYQSKSLFDPDIIALLARVLWDENQPDLALAYLERGLEQDKHNATLLSLNSRFLFEDGQDERAKALLLLAEEVDPSNSELAATRLYIANTLNETRNDQYCE